MEEQRDEGLRGVVREFGLVMLIFFMMAPLVLIDRRSQGHEMEILIGFPALGALVCLFRFLLADLSKRARVWHYAVWSFSCTLAALAGLAFTFMRSGFDGESLTMVLLCAPIIGALIGYRFRGVEQA